MPKSWRVGLLGLIVSGLALLFVLAQVSLADVGAALAGARYHYVVPCLAFLLAGLVARALRWQLLLGGRLALGRAFNIMNVAYLVNGVLPWRAGEVVRVFLSARGQHGVPVMQTAGTILTERLLDLLAVSGLLVGALAFGPPLQTDGNDGIITAVARGARWVLLPGGIAGFALLVGLAARRAFAERLVTATTRPLPPRAQHLARRWLAHFLDGLTPLTRGDHLLAALGWTAASWGFSVAAGYVLMYAFYPVASWAATALYVASAALAIAVPAVPGSIGPYEASIVVALDVMGYGAPLATASAFALVVHGVNVLLHALTGIVGLMGEGVSLAELRQRVQQQMQRPAG